MILDVLVLVTAMCCIFICSSGYTLKRRRRDNQVLTLAIISAVLLIFVESSWIIGYHLMNHVDPELLSIRAGIEIAFLCALSLFGFKR
jgi:membrane-associated HD superfamily phosphohydrolase